MAGDPVTTKSIGRCRTIFATIFKSPYRKFIGSDAHRTSFPLPLRPEVGFALLCQIFARL
jgi:hypothetical protein